MDAGQMNFIIHLTKMVQESTFLLKVAFLL